MIQFGVNSRVLRTPRRSARRRHYPRHARSHQPSAVENDPDRLAAFGLVLAGDQVSSPRGCRPADVAQVIALAVFAQALEVPPQSALARLPQLEVDLPAARQKDLLLFGGPQGRVDANRLCESG